MNDFKLSSTMDAIVLSANDVIATVLLIDIDEDGTRPIAITNIDLPWQARAYRDLSFDGKSMFRRGDHIEIHCELERPSHHKVKWTEKNLEELIDLLSETKENDLYLKIGEEQKKIDKEWQELCERDKMKKESANAYRCKKCGYVAHKEEIDIETAKGKFPMRACPHCDSICWEPIQK